MAYSNQHPTSGPKLEFRALEIAKEAHEGAFYGSVDFINHPLAVANIARFRGYGSSIIATCILHDTVEDTPSTLRLLADKGMPAVVILGVSGMTFTGNNTLDKIPKARSNPISHVGKHCDSTANRNQCVADEDGRAARYSENVSLLKKGLPTPTEIERFVVDFEKSFDQLEEEITQITAYLEDVEISTRLRLNSRVDELLEALKHKYDTKQLLEN